MRYKILIFCLTLFFVTVFLRIYKIDETFSFSAEYNYKLWPIKEIIYDHKIRLIGIEAALSLAVFFKETFMIHVATIGFLGLLHKSKKVFYMTILISFCLGFYLVFHFLNVNKFTNQGLAGLAPTSHPAGLFFLQQTLSYGSWEYLFFKFKPFSLLLLLSLICTVFLLFRKRLNFALSILVIPFFIFAISIIKIGSTPFDDYWGAAFVPLILITTPIVLLKLLKEDEFHRNLL